MSMNSYAGGNGTDPNNLGSWWVFGMPWRVYSKTGDMTIPGPAKTWIMIDEREGSINDGFWVVDMRGYPNKGRQYKIVDYPASYHNGSGGLSFADGHAEIRKWKDPRTTPPLKRNGLIPLNVASPNNQDVAWIQERTSRLTR